MSTKEHRLECAKATFKRVAPRGWTEAGNSETAQGGHSGVCVVVHGDGRRGVFRCLLPDATDVMKQRFYRELEIVPQMKHKNIMRLLDCTTDLETQWYISELGLPLDRYWRAQRVKFANDATGLLMRAIGVCEGIGAGLGAAHGCGVVHRDVKPGNVVLMSDGKTEWPVLIDFGIAYLEDEERLTQLDEAVGNARYSASPMAYRSDEVPPWYDVFELAQVLMWMLEHDRAEKHFWQRPLDWRFVKYDPRLPAVLRLELQSVTALCSQRETSPLDGENFVHLLRNKFHTHTDAARPGGLNFREINEIRATAKAHEELFLVRDIEAVAAAAPMALDAITPIQDAFVEMCKEASGAVPLRIALSRTRGELLDALKNMSYPPEIVVCRCHFGEKRTFNVQMEAIAYRPSLVQRSAHFKGLPPLSNPIVFKLSRSGDQGVNLRQLFQRLIVNNSGELVPWIEAHLPSTGESIGPADALSLLRRWSNDPDAWKAISGPT